jgi:putative endonuclease
MFYVYILRSRKDKRKYIGFTNNLTRRIQQHNNGRCTAAMNRGPFELMYSEEFNTRQEAAGREKFFKTGKGREYIKGILNL